MSTGHHATKVEAQDAVVLMSRVGELEPGIILWGEIRTVGGKRSLQLTEEGHQLTDCFFYSIHEFYSHDENKRQWRPLSPLELLAMEAE